MLGEKERCRVGRERGQRVEGKESRKEIEEWERKRGEE